MLSCVALLLFFVSVELEAAEPFGRPVVLSLRIPLGAAPWLLEAEWCCEWCLWCAPEVPSSGARDGDAARRLCCKSDWDL